MVMKFRSTVYNFKIALVFFFFFFRRKIITFEQTKHNARCSHISGDMSIRLRGNMGFYVSLASSKLCLN